MQPPLEILHLGLQPYEPIWRAMQGYTERRTEASADQIWLLQHPPVFTLGRAGRHEHLLDPGEIPVVQVDRGGQVTYHGPGQLILYLLLDLPRIGIGVRHLVSEMEGAVIALLAAHGVAAEARPDAPGVYVDGRKVASLGLRVRRGCTLHGLSLNVAMDREPFSRINPCGHPGLAVTELRELGIGIGVEAAGGWLVTHLAARLGYNATIDR